MEEKCFNFKFPCLLVCPVLGILLGCAFIVFSGEIGMILAIFPLLLSTTFVVILLFTEPIFYFISSQGITTLCAFRQHHWQWKQIRAIELKNDNIFKWLDFNDYILITRNQATYPKRYERIVKCKKTETLLEHYAKSKICE